MYIVLRLCIPVQRYRAQQYIDFEHQNYFTKK